MVPRCSSLLALALLICLVGVALASDHPAPHLNGGHMRLGSLSWKRLEESSNKVEFTVVAAFRYDYGGTDFKELQRDAVSDPGSVVGRKIAVGGRDVPVLSVGEAGVETFFEEMTVTGFSQVGNWILTSATFVHSYSTPNNQGQPWNARFTGCCWLSDLAWGRDDSWAIESSVDLTRFLSTPTWSVGGSLVQFHTKQGEGSSIDVPVSYRPEPFDSAAEPPSAPSLQLKCGHAGFTIVDNKLKVAASVPAGLYRVCLSAGAVGSSTGLETMVVVQSENKPVIEMSFDNVNWVSASSEQAAFVGFKSSVYLRAHPQSGSDVVGYVFSRLPSGATETVLPGSGASVSDPARKVIEWTPCSSGLYSMCFAASHSITSASAPGSSYPNDHISSSSTIKATSQPLCVSFSVSEDPLPAVSVIVEPASDATIGVQSHLRVVANDANPEDHAGLTVEVSGSSPSGATFHSASRTVSWTPAYDQGGLNASLCFRASEKSRTCGRPASSTTHCVSLAVRRCVAALREGQSLKEVAQKVGVSWSDLWVSNKDIHHPDNLSFNNQVVNLGHDYTVGYGETLADIGARFGCGVEALRRMNADLAATHEDVELPPKFQMCVLPDACALESSPDN